MLLRLDGHFGAADDGLGLRGKLDRLAPGWIT